MNKIEKLIREKRLFLDGGTGTMLQGMGLQAGEASETWNMKYPERITALQRSYYEAGANIIPANTFGINCRKYENYEEMIAAAIACTKKAAAEAVGGSDPKERFVAMDIGPTGTMIEPLGSLPFEEAVEIFAANVRAGVKAGADIFFVETMNDMYETRAAVIACRENSDLPVMVSNAYDERGRLMTGATPQAMIAMLEGLGVSAIGMNCSFGPDKMLEIIDDFTEYASVPLIFKPNAGLPRVVDGKTVFDVGPEEFSKYMVEVAKRGGHLMGGCCGTTPDHIRTMIEAVKDIPYAPPEPKNHTLIASYTHHVEIGDDPVLIGERINPTGKKKLREALIAGDMDYILGEAARQADLGAHALDVNVGLPEIDEPAMMEKVIKEIQAVSDLPLQIDTSDPAALERGLRIYNGKPLLNSVNAKQAVMDEVFPLAAKYGAAVVGLTIGEDGIPDNAEGRIELALRIVEEAGKYGIDRKNIIIDPLAMTISSGQEGAKIALEVVKDLTARGIRTIMGVSNISFGLPKRDLINQVFFANALSAGLSSAIMNPGSVPMMDTYHAFRALNCNDRSCIDYIAYAEARADGPAPVAGSGAVKAAADSPAAGKEQAAGGLQGELINCITGGRTARCRAVAAQLLSENTDEGAPLGIINDCIIPALNEVGAGYEAGRIYLPQLLMSAEAANAAFEEVKEKLPKSEEASGRRIIIATVRGDVHDIGKNIVRVLLESYGFEVTDLGKDVAPETVRDAVLSTGIRLVGLSALMTTTVPAMEETIKLLHETDPEIRVMVGGAVLSADYAKKIGADGYSKDGMEAVRLAESLL